MIFSLLAITHVATYGMQHNNSKKTYIYYDNNKTLIHYKNLIKLYMAASAKNRLNPYNPINPAKAIPRILGLEEKSTAIAIILPPLFIISKL